jgi:hypothetical protein
MYVNRTKALAETAMISALSVVVLILGTVLPGNTIFFTALAAYFMGVTVCKNGLSYAGMQFFVCCVCDAVFNPNKLNWLLYLCFGGYLYLCELFFAKKNHEENPQKKMRVQFVFNWFVFNVIYILLIVFGRQLLFVNAENPFEKIVPNRVLGMVVLWLAGQLGWLLYDKAYRAFFKWLQERRVL